MPQFISHYDQIARLPGQPVQDVTAHGASPSATAAVNTAAFEATENALPVGGGTILVPPGTYIVAYRVRKARVTLQGLGWGSCLKTQDAATALSTDCPVRVLADHCTIENLRIDGNKAGNVALDDFTLGRQADGIAIYANHATVRGCHVHDTIGHKIIVWNEAFTDAGGASSVNTARHGIRILDNLVTGTGQRAAIDVASTAGDTATNAALVNHGIIIRGNRVEDMGVVVHTANDILIDGNSIHNAALTTAGISVHTGSKRVNIVGNVISAASQGIVTSGVRTCERIGIHGNLVSGTSGSGISVSDTNVASVTGNCVSGNGAGSVGISIQAVVGGDFSANLVETSGGRGIAQGSTTLCSRVTIRNNVILSPATYGIDILNFQDGLIAGNYVYGGTASLVALNTSAARVRAQGNMFDSPSSIACYWQVVDSNFIDNTFRNVAAGDAIRADNCANAVFEGNRFIACAQMGIRLMSVAASAVTVRGNDLRGVTGTKVATQADTVVRDNLGYVTEANGTATVASGTTSIAVTHGLARTPALKDISVTPANLPANDVRWYVSAVAATTFTITTSGDPGAGGATFAWSAEVR